MNVLPILSVILGIISVMITITYMRHYDKLNYSLNKINANCISDNNNLNQIINIQGILDVSDIEFNELIKKNKNKLLKILRAN